MSSSLVSGLRRLYYHFKLNLYWLKVPLKVRRIRSKEKIRVLFVLSELSCWKSELLYQSMLIHKRFEPIIGVSTMQKNPKEKGIMISYLETKQYLYKDLDLKGSEIDDICPDIIFYYKPYSPCYTKGHFYDKNLKYIFCGLDYCIEATKHAVHLEKEMFDYCWQFYVEHSDVKKRRREVLGYRSRNTVLTGVPMQDLLLQPKQSFKDPWKDKTGKKRIIYAPHHSIKGTNGDGIEFATFLEFGETVLDFAKKYREYITIAFKPHPNLYMKLLHIWGKDKTESYYHEWELLDNTQIETGEYVGLFKYSDAIIHDCASFIVEYLYMDKPSMYLVSNTNNLDDMFDYVRQGFNCHEHGRTAIDIEMFINSLLNGNDNRKEERARYIKDHLLPPGGRTACQNIINSILG